MIDNHLDQFVTGDNRKDNACNRDNDRFRHIPNHREYPRREIRRGCSHLRRNIANLLVDCIKHPGQMIHNPADQHFFQPFGNRFPDKIHPAATSFLPAPHYVGQGEDLQGFRLTEQTGQERNESDADQGNAAARHKLFHPFCSRRCAIPTRFHLLSGEHPMFSHGRRLYLHPLFAGQTTSGRLTLLLQRIVVERPSVRGFAADCPFLPAFRFAPCAIHVFLSAFAAITLEPVSSLCCGTHGFRGSQQFSLSSCGLSPHASRQLLVRGGHSLPLRFGTGIVVAVTLQKVNRAPNTKASAESNNEGLENSNRFIKEIHTKYL